MSKDKEKENIKDKAESRSKKKNKFPKGFGNKCNPEGTTLDLGEHLPIFGVELMRACERGKCHDSIAIPLPIRESIDYVEEYGINFEYVYKIGATKNRVQQIKKMYNNREPVRFSKYDVPTATSVLKAFLRELPEPIIANELLVKFEEVSAIFNASTREKHFRVLINSLPPENHNLLAILVIHLHNVSQREQVNRMSKHNLAQALSHTLRVSTRLLHMLITHRMDLYPDTYIVKYLPPLEAGSPYPDDPEDIQKELRKLNSALDLIHWEMQQGFCSERRQDQLWDVQRIITDLKRKLKKASHPHEPASEEAEEIGQQAPDPNRKAEKQGATPGYYAVVDTDKVINSQQPIEKLPCNCPAKHLLAAFEFETVSDGETEPVNEADQKVGRSDSNSEEHMEQPEVVSNESVGPHSASRETIGSRYQRMTGDNRPRESKDNDSTYQNKSSGCRNECEQQASFPISEKSGCRPRNPKESGLSSQSKTSICTSDFQQQTSFPVYERSVSRPRDSKEAGLPFESKSSCTSDFQQQTSFSIYEGGVSRPRDLKESGLPFQSKPSTSTCDFQQQTSVPIYERSVSRPRDSNGLPFQSKSSGCTSDFQQQTSCQISEKSGFRPRDSKDNCLPFHSKSSDCRSDFEQQASFQIPEKSGCRPRDSKENGLSFQTKSSSCRSDFEQQASFQIFDKSGCRPRDSKESCILFHSKSSGCRSDLQQQTFATTSERSGSRPTDSREMGASYQRKSSDGTIESEQQAPSTSSQKIGCHPRDTTESSSSHRRETSLIDIGQLTPSATFQKAEKMVSSALGRTFSDISGSFERQCVDKECICTMTGFAEGMRYAERKAAGQRVDTQYVSVDDPFVENCANYNGKLYSLRAKNQILIALMTSLSQSIEQEKQEAEKFKKIIESYENIRPYKHLKLPRNYERVRQLLLRENHMLEIKKIQLVRHIMEYKERCVELEAEVKAAERRRSHK